MHGLRKVLIRVDDVIYAIERLVLLASVFMMTALVFSDVIQRTFSRPVGKTAAIVAWLVERFTTLSDSARESIHTVWGPATFGLLAVILFISGAHAARSARAERDGAAPESVSLPVSIAWGLGVLAVTAGAIKLLLVVAPSGIPGAQKLALGFLVWCGFLGASLGTRSKRHIVLDAVKKKLDPPTRAIVGVVGAFVTAGFCGFMGYMSLGKSLTMIQEWSASDGRIHRFESVPLPEWLVVIALPVCFGLIALRVLAHAFGELMYGAPLHEGEDEHGINLAALATEPPPETAAEASARAARLMGTPHSTTGELR